MHVADAQRNERGRAAVLAVGHAVTRQNQNPMQRQRRSDRTHHCQWSRRHVKA